ncbi:DUF2515 domain-containing protein [Caldibacillus lycopersici]|uniref:DUF2515 domain-containing protein n=1 Tax=Perspicuibacillus lycopersici TaxID=1325689 RepID=A0AAE3LMK0_9BACI|nr:DUF2515 domain-containing protein [Perspicuibacillus lycopersici]MCU9613675.1 DUF2515 domain-containing protein [Perspicuibacillus lycopersici]
MELLSNQEVYQTIISETKKGNMDNITRTEFYEKFYFQHPDILWSLLASFVSRNAGWNMCDLEGEWFPKVLSKDFRNQLFSTYERANWLIFNDAYPQLLLYHYSTILQRSMFHLLPKFNVSKFMEKEWLHYWNYRDSRRLLYALIINEQNLIQKPVIDHPFYHSKVFQSLPFKLQDLFHYSVVIFPTCKGELYGMSANQFVNLDKRIELGKSLASILFKNEIYDEFIKFISTTTHTGSRYDYEQYFKDKKSRDTPFLRLQFPVIHHRKPTERWDKGKQIKKRWYKTPKITNNIKITNWYKKKRKEIELFITLEEWEKLHQKDKES